MLKDLFGAKPWAHLGRVLQISDRLAKHRIYRTRDFTADELAELIRTEHGFEVIAAIMADGERKPPKWWRACAPLMQAHEARKLQIEAQRRIQRAVEDAWDEDEQTTMALERAEAALAISSANADRPVAVLGRAGGRVSGRPVAAAGRRG